MTQPATLTELPSLQPGVSIALLKRVWFATEAKCKCQRALLLDSIVTVEVDGCAVAKPLRDLTLAEVERAIGAVAPRFVVRFYQQGLKGVQVQTFVVREDADLFADGKKLYGKPAKVQALMGAR